MFAVLAFKLKVSIILKMKQQDYQITQQNWRVCEFVNYATFQQVLIWKFAFGPEKLPSRSRNRPFSTLSVTKLSNISIVDPCAKRDEKRPRHIRMGVLPRVCPFKGALDWSYSRIRIQSTPDNSNPRQLEPRAYSNQNRFPFDFLHTLIVILPSVAQTMV